MYDLIVIGAGSAGLATAKKAAKLGLKVAICEKKRIGGTCVIVGCVPKKLMVYAAYTSKTIKSSSGYGFLEAHSHFSWETLQDNHQRIVNMLEDNHTNTLKNLDIDIILGFAQLKDANHILINNTKLKAKHIVIATGATPRTLNCEGGQLAAVSDSLFHLQKKPKSIVIVGGGYIAVEFASLLSYLDVEVHLIVRSPRLLNGFDNTSVKHLSHYLEKRLKIHYNCEVKKISLDSNQHYQVQLSTHQTLSCEHLINATGRLPNIQNLNLKSLNISTDLNKPIPVNGFFQTSTPSIYAIGDCASIQQLTPLAIAQGRFLVSHLFETPSPKPFSTTAIPTAIFTVPEYACIGLTEEEAKKTYPDLKKYESTFTPLGDLMLEDHKRQKAYLKILCTNSDERIIGLHLVGPNAAEIIQGFSVSLTLGATKADFDATMALHPSLAEEFVTLT